MNKLSASQYGANLLMLLIKWSVIVLVLPTGKWQWGIIHHLSPYTVW